MEKVLEPLCNLFYDELERQETVLAVLRSQREAALAQDTETLEAKTAALEALIREAVQAEGERHQALGCIFEHYGLPAERQTLSELIWLAPEPWRSRMADFQKRIRAVVKESQRVVRLNGAVLRESLKIVDGCLDALHQDVGISPVHYDARGLEQPRRARGPFVIDQQG